jgi:hypothetical protein
MNNTYWDLYHQLMLIGQNNKRIFFKEGIFDLERQFKKADKGDISNIADVLQTISIRRTMSCIPKLVDSFKIIVLTLSLDDNFFALSMSISLLSYLYLMLPLSHLLLLIGDPPVQNPLLMVVINIDSCLCIH